MGEALFAGLFSAGTLRPIQVVVVEPVAARGDELRATYKALMVTTSLDGLEYESALIAVKPQHVAEVSAQIDSSCTRVLSVAAGVKTATIEAAMLSGRAARVLPVVRSMPNTPAMVGEGASAIAAGSAANDEDLAWAEGILGAVGVVERVDEKLIDAVTGLSGSGPAYVFLMAEALIEGGVAVGLPRSVAVSLAHQTIAGAGRMLVSSGDDAATLRANVTSPGGTTAAGLRALEHRGVRSAFIEAVAAATQRAHELG